jgi:phytoene synthase
MVSLHSYNIFKTGSRTFFTASLFFPKAIKQQVFDLYAFVRVADDYVDSIPADTASYEHFKGEYYAALKGAPTSNEVITRFVALQQSANFEQVWVDAFFASMDSDMALEVVCQTLVDTEQYMYGSAEVIGLMMARIMRLPDESLPYAQLLGRAFQYMNMVRDLAEDLDRHRIYLPQELWQQAGLHGLTARDVEENPEAFCAFIRQEIGRYRAWDKEARKGFRFIPKRYRIPIQTAADMFAHTMDVIVRNPLVVYRRKVRPSTLRIVTQVAKNTVVG